MNSPLGKYAAPAAALASLAVIGAYLAALLFSSALNVPPASLDGLKTLALIAAGALFGSAVAVNGYKAPLTAATDQIATLTEAVAALRTATAALHKRADEAGIPAAGDGVDPAAIGLPGVIHP